MPEILRTRPCLLAAAILFFCLSNLTSAFGAESKPHLIKDINLDRSGSDSLMSVITDIETGFVFMSGTDVYKPTLWRSDGTPEGTTALGHMHSFSHLEIEEAIDVDGTLFFTMYFEGGLWKSDITNGPVLFRNGPIGSIVKSKNSIFFTEYNGNFSGGCTLLKSDGTAEGTTIMKGGFSWTGPLTIINGYILFFADDPSNGTALWKTDGKAGGTIMLKSGFSLTGSIAPVNGSIVFLADDASNATVLWKTDGTAEGTVAIKIVDETATYGLPELINVNGTLFFPVGDYAGGFELWKSDGTPEGTLVVKDITPKGSSHISGMTDVNGIAFFFIEVSGYNGKLELWKSDGSLEGTIMVKDIDPAWGIQEAAAVDNSLYFVVDQKSLWKSDGTAEGTVMLKGDDPGIFHPASLTALNDALFFTANDGIHGNELWKSDGTPDGTIMIKDICPTEEGHVIYLTNINDNLYFWADDGIHGYELWKSDGTPEGTELFKDLNTTTGDSAPSQLTAFHNDLFFTANDGAAGCEVWKSDGTEAGTNMLKDIKPVFSDSCPGIMTIMNDNILFDAGGLWRSDGTPGGTVMVNSVSSRGSSVTMNGILFFAGSDGVHEGLWRSDGTSDGTFMVSDVDPMMTSDPNTLINAAGTLFFIASDYTHAMEVWKSDGTASGTALVKDIRPGRYSSYPLYLMPVGRNLFFQARDYNGAELWKSDGTESGTNIVKDINPSGDSYPRPLYAMNGTLFFSADDGINGVSLWKTDGTLNGAVIVKDSAVQNLTEYNNRLFFISYDSDGQSELWKSDGTANGTTFVKAAPYIGFLTPANGTLFFIAGNASNDAELWKSDGTPQGTVKIKELVDQIGFSNAILRYPTILFSELYFFIDYWTEDCQRNDLWKTDGTPNGTIMLASSCTTYDIVMSSSMLSVADMLFFTAYDPVHGQELWAYAPPANPPMVYGVTPTNDTTPTWSWTTGGRGNGAFRYQLDSEAGAWTETTRLSFTPSSPLPGGAHTLYVQEQNKAGDWSDSGSKTILVDITPPTGSIIINGGVEATKTALGATLTLTSSDESGSPIQMCISNSPTCAAYSWSAFTPTKSWMLTTGNGIKTVFVWFKDKYGNVNPVPYSDTIIVDSTAPANGKVTGAPGNSQVTLNWSGFTDTLSGIGSYRIVYSTGGYPPYSCSTGTSIYSGTDTSFVHTGRTNGTTYSYRVCGIDKAGNISAGATASVRPVPETNLPTGSIVINGGAEATRSAWGATLTLTASDDSGNPIQMCVSNSASCTAYSWTTFVPTKSWTLSYGNGTKTVYVWFKDKWGNVNPVPYSDTIVVDGTAPANGRVTGTPGNTQITLNWSGFSDALSGIGSYKVVYSTGSYPPYSCSAGTSIYTGPDTSVVHSGRTNGTTYSYRVCAIDKTGNMSSGASVSVKPTP